jgi:hypothetical protein
MSAVLADGSDVGTPMAAVPITVGVPLPADFVIDGFDLEITNSTGGSGSGGTTDYEDGDNALVVANDTVNINITGISGAYQGNPFTPADAGGAVPQAEYDTALDAAAGLIGITLGLAGDANARFTGPVMVITGTGASRTGVVFPDHDPESVGPTAEGTMMVSLPASGTFVPAQVDINLTVDVDVDVDAPQFTTILPTPDGVDGDGNTLLSGVTSTMVVMNGTWGAGGAPGTIDGTTAPAQLFDFNLGSGADMTFTSDPPDAAMEYRVADTGGGNFVLTAMISPNDITLGSVYTIRLNSPVFNSVNLPGTWLAVSPPPPAEELNMLPGNTLPPDVDDFFLIYQNPKIRRIPQVIPDILSGNVDPENADGFGDVFNSDTAEFQVATDAPNLYPQITIIQGTDPNTINQGTASIGTEVIFETQPHRIGVDIAAYVDPGGVDPPVDYALKVWGKPTTPGDLNTRVNLGFATFQVLGLAPALPAIVGVDFGMNVFDAGGGPPTGGSDDDRTDNTNIAGRDFTTKAFSTLNLPVFEGPGAPATFFVEFNGGRVGSAPAPGDPNPDVVVVFERFADGATRSHALDVRVSGLGGGGLNFLGHTVFSTADKQDGIGPGIFLEGQDYWVQLTYLGNPNPNFQFDPAYPDDLSATTFLSVTN